ncbi:unnamed protein product [Parnassius mnemosyne]|uniref:Uncharacterized protein n=1 Tax=Parnassius mnemosyne TaxID=213953 RepID=A0AAV1KY19_9NEOP
MELETVCRTCLGKTTLNPLFSNSTDRYSKDIYLISGVKIEYNDGFPQNLCLNCVSSLNDAIKFRELCITTESHLLKFKNGIHDKVIERQLETEFKVETLPDEHVEIKQENDETKDEDDKPLKSMIEMVNSFDDFKLDISENTIKTHSETSIKCESNGDLISDVSNVLNEKTVHSQDSTKELKNENTQNHIEKGNTETRHNTEPQLRQKRVTCKICQKNLSIRSIAVHMNKCHPGTDERKVKCELCDKFVLRDRLRIHQLKMHGPDLKICAHCKLQFDSKQTLLKHVSTCSAKKKRKKYESGRKLTECDVCHKEMQRGSLRLHKAVKHAGLGPVCEHCGRRFGNKLRLLEHCRARHGHDKFQCGSCHFQSASLLAMTNHERRHRGEKPFVCERCGANFHAAYLLAQHKHSHRTERPYTCSQCPARFKANNSLHMHRINVHGGQRGKRGKGSKKGAGDTRGTGDTGDTRITEDTRDVGDARGITQETR